MFVQETPVLSSRGARVAATVTVVALGVAASVMADGSRGFLAIAPEFADDYTIENLGAVPGAPSGYGGMTFAPGDPETLLIGTDAVAEGAAVYAIDVVRGCFNEVVGFGSVATLVAQTPFIDSGLIAGPGGVLLYTTYDGNELGQIKPGSNAADRMIDLASLGVEPSTGSVTIVPDGFPGAGRLKIATYDAGGWYDALLVPDGSGTFDVTDVTFRVDGVGNGLEGLAWIAGGQPHFDTPHVLVNNWDAERIDVIEVSRTGDPLVDKRRTFAFVNGPEGAAADPRTPDILVSSLGPEDFVAAIRLPGPCAADMAPEGGDGDIGAAELLAILASWGEACTPVNFDREGEVGFAEMLGVLRQWGPCP